MLVPEVRSLLHQLRARGYVVIQQLYTERSFGNALIDLQRGCTRVRVVRDRGQWLLDMCGARDEEWWAPAVWRAWLTAWTGPIGSPAIGDQVDMLLEDLPQVEAANERDDRAPAAGLREAQSQRSPAWMKEMLGGDG